LSEEKKKTTAKKEVEELRKEIELKGREIQELRKKVEELKAQISKEKTSETPEVDKMLKDVSEILDVGFNVFGISSNKQDEKTGSRGLIGLVGELAKLAEESRSYRKEIDFGGKKGVIDFTVRAGPLSGSGRSSFARPRSHATVRKRSIQSPTDLVETTAPLVDIFDEEDSLKVVVELPGIEKNDISLELAEGFLTIKADSSLRKYYKEVKLPAMVEKEVVDSTYRNGILEVKLKKKA